MAIYLYSSDTPTMFTVIVAEWHSDGNGLQCFISTLQGSGVWKKWKLAVICVAEIAGVQSVGFATFWWTDWA